MPYIAYRYVSMKAINIYICVSQFNLILETSDAVPK